MYVLHAAWIPRKTDAFIQSGGFYLWVESTEALKRPGKGRHPRHLPKDDLAAFLERELSIEAGSSQGPLSDAISRQSMQLPTSDAQPLPSPELALVAGEELPDQAVGLAHWEVDCYRLQAPIKSLGDLHFLSFYQAGDTRAGSDFLFWYWFTQSLKPIALKDHYLPALLYREAEGKGRTKAYEIYSGWEIVSEPYEKLIRQSIERMPPVCADGYDMESLLRHCAEVVIGELVGQIAVRLPSVFVKKIADSTLEHFLHAKDPGRPWRATGDPEVIRQWSDWRRTVAASHESTGFQLGFQLCEAAAEEPDAWRLAFLVTARDDPSYQLTLGDYWGLDPSAGNAVHKRFGETFEKQLLLDLGAAARIHPAIWQGLQTDRPAGIRMTLDDAFDFLKESAWVLEDAGFKVIVPAWWTPQGRRRAKIRLRASGGRGSATAAAGRNLLSLDHLLDYQYKLAIGDQQVSEEEWAQLVDAKTPLVHFRGQWMELDRNKMAQMLEFWQRHGEETPQISVQELIRTLAEKSDTFEVESDDALAQMLAALHDASRLQPVDNPGQLKADLRAYQKRGVAWLRYLERLGLNGCLADDMGLGKTMQVIAVLLMEKEHSEIQSPTLLVAPTSVIGNWQKEIERFASCLKTFLHYGAERERSPEAFGERCRAHDMVITSYPLLRRDAGLFSAFEWRRIVLDEAQNIKNPKAAQTKAIFKLKAGHRLALTGTPVENRLMDLWSIFNFLNPGYLGKQAQFRKHFELPIQRDNDPVRSATLKKLVEPFILRRLKTDKDIIEDLPDKVENRQYCNLSKEQASLYEAVVDEVAKELERSEGIQRQGLMLSTLMKLKQICNHPMQFLQDGSPFTPERSHKLERLSAMLEEVIAEGDSVLIFTQFTEIGEQLQHYLQQMWQWNTYYLHGGTSRTKRDTMIGEFQAPETEPSIFILSLKAGGVGITLTRANHVFHFDRWWNPAVEDQATDRAFRIGQKKNVFVHKFVTLGTLEERIDQMIEEKKQIAETIVGSDESWLTRLDNDTFKELIAFNKQTILE
jgi:SNF2 family DNA or RNA helicase